MRNETAWLELYDTFDLFSDDDDPRHAEAWKWAEALQKGGRLTSSDVFALQCLLGAFLAHPRTEAPAPVNKFRCHNCKHVVETYSTIAPFRCPECPGRDFSAVAPSLAALPDPASDGLRDALEAVDHWLIGVIDADMAEIVADGGITAAMVVQQEAKWQRTKILRALAKDTGL